MYVLDHGARLVAITEQLFGCSPFLPGAVVPPVALWPALETMMSAVITLQQIDPLIAELVRLRGARVHRCRLCQSRRLIAAVEVDAELLDVPDALSDKGLTDAQRAALLLTDAILLSPASVPPETLEALRRSFTPAQALELALLVAHNAANKIAVALGADAPSVTDGFEYFSVDVSGSYQYGIPKP
jgi:alkylhydroperoxidase family enzyme